MVFQNPEAVARPISDHFSRLSGSNSKMDVLGTLATSSGALSTASRALATASRTLSNISCKALEKLLSLDYQLMFLCSENCLGSLVLHQTALSDIF